MFRHAPTRMRVAGLRIVWHVEVAQLGIFPLVGHAVDIWENHDGEPKTLNPKPLPK